MRDYKQNHYTRIIKENFDRLKEAVSPVFKYCIQAKAWTWCWFFSGYYY